MTMILPTPDMDRELMDGELEKTEDPLITYFRERDRVRGHLGKQMFFDEQLRQAEENEDDN